MGGVAGVLTPLAEYWERVKTRNELVDLALREFVQQHERADVRELRGKRLIDPAYDYRAARRGELS